MSRHPEGPAPRVARPTRSGAGRTLYHGTALLGPDARPGGARPAGEPRGGGRGGRRTEPRVTRRRGRGRAWGRLVALALTLVLVAGAAGAAWKLRVPLARAAARIHLGRAHVSVIGLEYLSPAEVLRAAGLSGTEPFFGVDLERTRQRLLRHPRVRSASVERRLNGELAVVVEERLPVVLVPLGRLTEVDVEGRVLPPLVGGEVPDLPVVTGLAAPVDGWVRDTSYARAVRWVRALGAREVGLLDRVSELDVGSDTETRAVMSPTGVRVLLPTEPDDVEQLSAVRVVLADLAAKGRRAALIDCRARGQAVVEGEDRPATPAGRTQAAGGERAPGAPGKA